MESLEPSGCQHDANANWRGKKRNETEQQGKSLQLENLTADRLVSAESQGTRSSAWERNEAVGCYMLDGKIKSCNSSEVICHF